jgi:hypothetical protein
MEKNLNKGVSMLQVNFFRLSAVCKSFCFLSSIFCLLPFQSIHAQLYPVQAITAITPPYSIYLSDYCTPGTDKLSLNLLLTNASTTNYPVKLRLIIEGEGITISTTSTYMPEQIILNGGSPLRLTGDELAAYFDPRYLDFKGYSKQKFQQTGALPEGIYRIGFQVFDYNKNIPVSLTGASMAWLVLNDPPIINMPDKNVKLTATEPQNIMFQWMPRHLGSPNSAFNAEYVLQIFEIWPGGRNPNEVVNSTQPLIEKILQTTTSIYSNTQDVALEPGRQYAFRVQARDVEGRDLFRNHGYSEVQMFTYGDPCDVPLQVEAQATGSDGIKISWQPTPYNTAFYIQYREANKPDAEWFPKNTFLSITSIDKLKPQTTYEYQVKGMCGTVNSDFSETKTITTQAKKVTDFQCGRLDSALLKASKTPLSSLVPGDIISSGKFEVLVTKATKESAGRFSGEGNALMPFLGLLRVKVEFKNISINDHNQVLSGRIVSTYNPNSKFVAHTGGVKYNPGDTAAAKEPTPINIKGDTLVYDSGIDTLYRESNGDVLVVGENGDTARIVRTSDETLVISQSGDTTALAAGKPVYVKDSEGNVKMIDANGNITSVNTKTAAKNPITVTFTAGEDQKYGYDAYNSKFPILDDPKYYDKEIINGKEYHIPWKSIQRGDEDKSIVHIKPEKSSGTKPNVKITEEDETVIALQPTSTPGDSVKLIQINAPSYEGSELITATYSETDTSKQSYTAGKLKLVSYESLPLNVVLVPVNNNKLNDGQLQTALTKMLGQACVNVDVTTASAIQYDNEPIDANPANAISYTDDMLALIDKIKGAGGYSDNNYYLFLLNQCKGANKAGIMPFNQNFGFIFVNGQQNLERTIAHELGHGAFGLLHTFKTYGYQPQFPKETRGNLMDSLEGAHLFKYQWDLMHHPVCYTEVCWDGSADDAASSVNTEQYLITILKKIRFAVGLNKKCILDNGAISITVKDIKIENNSYPYFRIYAKNFTSQNALELDIHNVQSTSDGWMIDNKLFIEIPSNKKSAIHDYLFTVIKKPKIIFVNGHWKWAKRAYDATFGLLNAGPIVGGRPYWSNNLTFEGNALKYFGIVSANFIYPDGSSSWGFDQSGGDRKQRGIDYAKGNFDELVYDLGKGDPIYFIGHSEGCAFAAGIAEYLKNQGLNVKEIAFLSADEGDEFTISPDIETYQIVFMFFTGITKQPVVDDVVGNHRVTGVEKYGVIIRNDLNDQYLHGGTNDAFIFDYLVDLKKVIIIKQCFNQKGQIKKCHTGEIHGTKFYQIDQDIIDINIPDRD